MPPGDVEGALADADVSIDALLGKEASAGEPAYRLAGNVSVEFDVALVEEQVRACGLRSGYAREPSQSASFCGKKRSSRKGASPSFVNQNVNSGGPWAPPSLRWTAVAARCPQGTRMTPDEAVIGPWKE